MNVDVGFKGEEKFKTERRRDENYQVPSGESWTGLNSTVLRESVMLILRVNLPGLRDAKEAFWVCL